MTANTWATKADLEEIVGRVVGTIVGDALQLVSNQFDAMNKKMDQGFAAVDRRFEEVDKRFEAVDQRFEAIETRLDRMDKRFDRIEDKLDASIAVVDHHTIDIRELQRKAA